MNTQDRESDIQRGTPVIIPLEPRRRRIRSLALFRGYREIVIVHQGAEYRLRITKGDKLVLTK
jgi:hemin uptake protein HemP